LSSFLSFLAKSHPAQHVGRRPVEPQRQHVPHEVPFPSTFGGAAYAIVGQHCGSISAEHDIGSIKREFLHHSRSAAELALMRLLKSTLDPKGILNPGKVV
jgi:FAD/FMN-containing dehydrogenase